MDLTCLRESGLTDGEIKVYIALLTLGSSTTGAIIDESGIARSIVYQILEKLIQKGLVSFITKEKTRYYQGAPPVKILDYIDQRQGRLKHNRDEVEKILPQLMLKQSLSKKSEASVYTGLKGVRSAFEHMYLKLGKGEEYTCLGIPADQPPEQHAFWKKDHLRRMKAGFTCRLLFNSDTDPEIVADRNCYSGVDARLMPTKIVTPAMFVMFKDTVVVIVQSETPLAFEIVNEQVAKSFQSYFEEFWKQSTKLPHKRV